MLFRSFFFDIPGISANFSGVSRRIFTASVPKCATIAAARFSPIPGKIPDNKKFSIPSLLVGNSSPPGPGPSGAGVPGDIADGAVVAIAVGLGADAADRGVDRLAHVGVLGRGAAPGVAASVARITGIV